MRIERIAMCAMVLAMPSMPAWAQSAPEGRDADAVPMAALPANDNGVEFGFTAGVATDYRFRSISQTDRAPFVYALASVSSGDFYARVGGENVDFNDGTRAEYDLYAGWAPRIGDTAFDIGVVRYGYIGGPAGQRRDTVEYKASISHRIGKGAIGAQVFYAPNFLTLDTRALYTEVNASYALASRLTVSGVFGVEQIHRFDDFKAWNLGATYALTKRINLDLRYHDTDAHANGSAYRSALVAGVRLGL